MIGGLFFLAFNALILLAISWYVDQERGRPSAIADVLFQMRNMNKGKPQRLTVSRRI